MTHSRPLNVLNVSKESDHYWSFLKYYLIFVSLKYIEQYAIGSHSLSIRSHVAYILSRRHPTNMDLILRETSRKDN